VFDESVTVTLSTMAPRPGVCELCGATRGVLRRSVVIRHARGGTVSFSACSRCTAAMRRVNAAAGGATPSGPAHLTPVPDRVVPDRSISDKIGPDVVGQPVLVHEFAERMVAEDGELLAVRVFGQGRADGTWLGWLTFAALDGRRVKRTPRETTQSTREQVAYWATGLQASYLEGAFRRAS
jgi:hypothetical protein